MKYLPVLEPVHFEAAAIVSDEKIELELGTGPAALLIGQLTLKTLKMVSETSDQKSFYCIKNSTFSTLLFQQDGAEQLVKIPPFSSERIFLSHSKLNFYLKIEDQIGWSDRIDLNDTDETMIKTGKENRKLFIKKSKTGEIEISGSQVLHNLTDFDLMIVIDDFETSNINWKIDLKPNQTKTASIESNRVRAIRKSVKMMLKNSL